MKIIIATEEVTNEHGDLIKIVYHYEETVARNQKKVFITPTQLAKR